MSPDNDIRTDVWAIILQDATIDPEDADLEQLWQTLDAVLIGLDTSSQLEVAANAVAQITRLFQERSQLVFEALDAANSHDDPIMAQDAFAQFVRQSIQVDFVEFIALPGSIARKPYERHQSGVDSGNSIAGVVEKDKLLQVLEKQEMDSDADTVYQQAIQVAYVEDISAWSEAIAYYLHQQTITSIGLGQLQQALTLPLIEIWLGLLLGGYQMQARDPKTGNSRIKRDSDWFYSSEIWIESGSHAASSG